MDNFVVGNTYTNRNGSTYYLEKIFENGDMRFRRTGDRWTLRAHGVKMYLDGLIEWDYSTGGHWPKTPW